MLASTFGADAGESEKVHVIPPKRTRYLSEIADSACACLQRLDGCPSLRLPENLQALRIARAELADTDRRYAPGGAGEKAA